jgi:hypothetical protein
LSYLANVSHEASSVPLARLVAAHMANADAVVQSSVTLDPQSALGSGAAASTANGHRQVLVCMLGGGNYTEYAALQQLADAGVPGVQGRVEVGYCASAMVNSENMITEWAKMSEDGDALGTEIKQAHLE